MVPKGGKSGKGNKSAGGGGGGGGEDLDDIKRDLDSILGRGAGGTIGVPSLVRTTLPNSEHRKGGCMNLFLTGGGLKIPKIWLTS